MQTLSPDLVRAAFGRSVSVSPLVALEPRKRKFHQVAKDLLELK